MKRRCLVSKEVEYTDNKAGELLALMRAGFNVQWLDGDTPRPLMPVVPAARPSTNGEATIERRHRRTRFRRRVNLTPQEINELIALRKKGCATRTLARKFKMSVSGVRNALHRAKGKEGGSE